MSERCPTCGWPKDSESMEAGKRARCPSCKRSRHVYTSPGGTSGFVEPREVARVIEVAEAWLEAMRGIDPRVEDDHPLSFVRGARATVRLVSSLLAALRGAEKRGTT